MIDYLSFFLVSSRSSSTPLYPQNVTNQGACINSLLFRYFHLKFTFESIKVIRGASPLMAKCVATLALARDQGKGVARLRAYK
jgi:hypothetical protein